LTDDDRARVRLKACGVIGCTLGYFRFSRLC